MSPLVSIFVIMLFTVVYNESQFVADYPDDYEKVLTKNAMPIDLCDTTSKRKLCKKPNKWREFLKNIDYIRDDGQDFSHENVHDDFEDEDINAPNVKTTQKRDHLREKKGRQCVTFKTHVDLGDGYYPRMIGNVTCNRTANELLKMCNCQPVSHVVRVLSRHSLRGTIPQDVPRDFPPGCWLLEDIPIHIGCSCG